MKKKLSLAFALSLFILIAVWIFFSPARVLTEAQLNGELKRVSSETIQTIVQPYIGESFWRVDLEKLHADLLRLEWVYKATVKRRWPNKVIISLEEQKPVARWREDGLLNQSGDVFYPHDITPFKDWVVLEGSPLQSRKLLHDLMTFQEVFKSLDWTIDALKQQPDGSWDIHFLSGVTVLLDNEDWQAKLSRFIRALPKTKQTLRKFAQVFDLRYSNGFVIKQKKQLEE